MYRDKIVEKHIEVIETTEAEVDVDEAEAKEMEDIEVANVA